MTAAKHDYGDELVNEIADQMRRYENARRLLLGWASLATSSAAIELGSLEKAAEYPRWRSGVEAIDRFGGFYGVTVVGGTPGSGKSMLALGSSLLAAEHGLCVVYLDAENSGRMVWNRISRWFGSDDLARAALTRLGTCWNHARIGPGTTLDSIMSLLLSTLDATHEGLLIVVDSLNTLAEFNARTSQESFDTLRTLLFTLDRLVQLSDGFISVLGLSELNADGDLKGRKSAYIASLVLNVERQDDEVVRLRITKSRDGRMGDLGLHRRDWRVGRFLPPERPE